MPDQHSIFDSVSAFTGLQIRRFTLAVAVLSVAAPLYATEQDDKDSRIEEIVVTVDLGSLPDDGVRSMFGFNKSLLETPRSASSVSEEMMDRFIVRDIDEMIALAPGSFTQSFFGVAGTLDIRGTPGETYFRGVRRLDNPGNYPTPLGASSRVDIVRGPASPIHGPSKIGGYINFNPKSARIEESGEFITEATGAIGVDIGSWDRRGGQCGTGRTGTDWRPGFRLLAVRTGRGLWQLLSQQQGQAETPADFLLILMSVTFNFSLVACITTLPEIRSPAGTG